MALGHHWGTHCSFLCVFGTLEALWVRLLATKNVTLKKVTFLLLLWVALGLHWGTPGGVLGRMAILLACLRRPAAVLGGRPVYANVQ